MDSGTGRRPRGAARLRFDGHIAGAGSTSGVRLVIGCWPGSPFGPVSDVMLQETSGRRVLLAPTRELADFVATTYQFDDVQLSDVDVEAEPGRWRISAGPLRLRIGGRTGTDRLLRAVPRPLAAAPAWAGLIDPVASRVMSGVRTRGSAGGGRRAWYGALDVHRVVALSGSWRGDDVGLLAPVRPPVQFGFGSVPAAPSLVRVVTTVEL